jgi:putative transposase
VGPLARRQVAQALVVNHALSVQRACRTSGLSRSGWYRPVIDTRDDAEVVDALQAVVERHGRWGFWKCFRRLRLDGHGWNHKRVWRVYCQLKLNLPRRTKKRLPRRERQTLEVPMQANALWSMDFMADTLYSGRRFRTFNVLDEGVREALAIEIDTSLRAERVIRVLEQLKDWRGLPQAIRCDNGPEYTSQDLVDWCGDHGIELRYIQPGKPNQNAYIERFNKTYRTEVLDAHLFEDLDQVREITDTWLQRYNDERPHESLGNLPPSLYRELRERETSPNSLST